MAGFLLELAIRTTLVACGTAIVLRLLRIQAAAARHVAWTIVLVAMLALPMAITGGWRMSVPVLTPVVTEDAGPAFVDRAASALETVTDTTASASGPIGSAGSADSGPEQSSQASLTWLDAALSLYLAGAVILLIRLGTGTFAASRIRRRAVAEHGRLTSDRCATPITVGWFKPVLILPRGWTAWSPAQLAAVLTHEQEHTRRRDPLVQWLALLNRALFWFHPLAWWLERRLATLAEEACDAVVIAGGHSPQDYSEYLIDMARTVSRHHGRVRLVGMAMPGAGLPNRLHLILRGLPTVRVSRTQLAATIAFCTLLSVIGVAGTLAERSPQQEAGPPISFDVVAIRPCAGLPAPGTGRGQNPRYPSVSSGYAFWGCATLAELVNQAYVGDAAPLLNRFNPRAGRGEDSTAIRGGPSWIYEDRFAIEARAAGADRAALTGPMLRALLEQRFQLKVQRATEEEAMYSLTLAAGPSKLIPTRADECWERPAGARPGTAPPAGFEGKPACGNVHGEFPDGRSRYEFTGITLQSFAQFLSSTMVRYVLNRTSLEGRFNITLEYAPDGHVRGAVDSNSRPGGPNILKALETMGLTLEPTRGRAEYLRIESAQRPKPDVPQASVPPPMQIQFEAVSIRPCESSAPTSGRGGGGMRNTVSPGYASWGCVSLAQLIDQAYGGGPFPKNALLNTIRTPPGDRLDAPKRIRGGPSWIENEKFAIEIRMSGDTTSLTGSARHDTVLAAMAPAMRAMLEDRFQLKLRKATEERPMYALAVKPDFAMSVSAPEKCWNPEDYPRPPGLSRMELPPPPPGWEGIPACGYQAHGGRVRGNEFTQFTHIDLASFAMWLSRQMDRYVLDKTNTSGRYSFRLEFVPDDSTPGILERNQTFARAGAELLGRTPPPQEKGDGPTIFKALDALGFKLESTRGPAEYLQVESAQRPKPGGPGPSGS